MTLRGAWARSLLIPSLADVLLAALVLRPFFIGSGFSTLLGDANLGLQLRAGDLLRSTGALPTSDPFSFALPGKPWFFWEWLTAFFASIIHEHAGLSALAVIALALITASFALTFRTSIRVSNTLWPALILLPAGFFAASIHLLARPFLVSWIFLSITTAIVLSGRRLWLLIPLCGVWANIHGAFFTIPAYLGLLAAGSFFEDRVKARRYALYAAGCLSASLLNPFGYQLHLHVIEFMSSGWGRELVDELHPPSPRLGEPFWWFLIFSAAAAIALISLLRRRDFAPALVIAFFLWSAARSARHIPVLVFMTTPLVAAELGRLWQAWAARFPSRNSLPSVLRSLESDLQPQFARFSIWIPALLLAALLFPAAFHVPADYAAKDFPTALVDRNLPRLISGRLFTSDLWADYLVYRGAPRIRVWVHGNNDYFGPDLGEDYLEILGAGPRAQELIQRWRFDTFLVPAGGPLAAWLRRQPDWSSIDRTPLAELFVKRATS